MTGESRSRDITERIRTAIHDLQDTYAVNWTTAFITLGLMVFAHLLELAVRYEYGQGALSASAAQGLLDMVFAAKAAIVGFWLVLCLLAWLGPEQEVN